MDEAWFGSLRISVTEELWYRPQTASRPGGQAIAALAHAAADCSVRRVERVEALERSDRLDRIEQARRWEHERRRRR